MKNHPLQPHANPSRTNQPRSRSRIPTSGGGFTLIEMLVVLGIAALIIPILMVSTSLLSQGFSEKQALSQVNAALSLARATAIRDGQDAALLFMADENGTTILQIASIAPNQGNTNFPRFIIADDRSPEKLAEGIYIASPITDFNSNQYYIAPQLNPTQDKGRNYRFEVPSKLGLSIDLVHFAVRFRPDGTIARTDTSGETAYFWFDHNNDIIFDEMDNSNASTSNPEDPDKFADDPTFQPVDILALYDKAQAEAFDVASDPQKLKDWINNPQQNEGKAFVILFNRYTGLALRSAN